MSINNPLVCDKCNKSYKLKSYYNKHIESCNKTPTKKENTTPIQDDNNNNNSIPTQSIEPLKFIDLFCGIGGFHQAMIKLNAKCVFASDIDKDCRKIYKENYNISTEGDNTQIEIYNILSL